MPRMRDTKSPYSSCLATVPSRFTHMMLRTISELHHELQTHTAHVNYTQVRGCRWMTRVTWAVRLQLIMNDGILSSRPCVQLVMTMNVSASMKINIWLIDASTVYINRMRSNQHEIQTPKHTFLCTVHKNVFNYLI